MYHHTMSYINAETNINEKLVEMDITSVRDFTVQGDITTKIWLNFV